MSRLCPINTSVSTAVHHFASSNQIPVLTFYSLERLNSNPSNGPHNPATALAQQQRQQARGGSPITAQQPPQSMQQSPQVQQQPQQRPAYPWSARRLLLPPPILIPKPGVAAPNSPSPSPFPRYGHALPTTATASGDLYLFGGLVRETARNDLYLFSTRDLSATFVQTAGEIPSPRVGHASAIISSVLIVWGGDTKTDPTTNQSDKQDDGLYLLNLGAFILLVQRIIVHIHPQFHESGPG